MVINVEILKIFQVILFSIPVLALLVTGLIILLRPIAVLNRKWLLLFFLPLILANIAAIFTNESIGFQMLVTDWQFWLILCVDLAMAVVGAVTIRGYAVYGLTPEQVEQVLLQAMTDAGYPATAARGHWKSNWGRASEAIIVTWEAGGGSRSCAITSRLGEVIIHTQSRSDLKPLSAFIGDLRHRTNEYEFSQHAVGVLYLVMAVILAVFGWIYFFEPRLVLIE